MPVLTVVAWIAVILGLVTAAVILVDEIAHPQRMAIMNVVWPVTGLYFPLIGLWFYYAMGRPMAGDAPPPGREGKPHWQSVFVSATHCGSGCVIGDTIGAPIVFTFGLTLLGERLFAEYLVEFLIAYLFGIAFQYLPIRATRRISRGEAIKEAVEADTIALIAFEVGLFGWMALVAYVLLPLPAKANSIIFWFMMQIGMVIGFLTTYDEANLRHQLSISRSCDGDEITRTVWSIVVHSIRSLSGATIAFVGDLLGRRERGASHWAASLSSTIGNARAQASASS
jgi:hypothetical protein